MIMKFSPVHTLPSHHITAINSRTAVFPLFRFNKYFLFSLQLFP